MAVRDIASAPRTTTLPRPQSRTAAPTHSPAQAPSFRPHVPHGKSRGRLGSQQVVSVRGRRVAPAAAKQNPLVKTGGLAAVLLVVGVAIAMVLSGLSTTQTFTIQELQSQERTLKNEVESLNRDLEDLQSSAEIAQRASESGMLVASEPGVVDVSEDGRFEKKRDFNPESVSPVRDVNGAPTRGTRASSDQRATSELGDSLTRVPGGNVLGQNAPSAGQASSGQGAAGQAVAGQAAQAGPNIDNLQPYQPNVPANF